MIFSARNFILAAYLEKGFDYIFRDQVIQVAVVAFRYLVHDLLFNNYKQ